MSLLIKNAIRSLALISILGVHTLRATEVDANNDSLNVCPYQSYDNALQVSNNDFFMLVPVDMAEFSIEIITPDPDGLVTVDPDGFVDILGLSCGMIKTVTYRIFKDDDPTMADTAQVTITSFDNEAPIFTALPDLDTVYVYSEYELELTASPVAIDACSGLDEVYLDEHRVYGACDNSYKIERKWVAVDSCGNRATTDIQVIFLVDTLSPFFDQMSEVNDTVLSCVDEIPAPEVLVAAEKDFTANPNLMRDYIPVDIKTAMGDYDTDAGDPFGLIFEEYPVLDYLESPSAEQIAEWEGITMTLSSLDGGEETSRHTSDFGSYGMRLYNSGFRLEFSDTVLLVLSGNPSLTGGEKLSVEVDTVGFLSTFEGGVAEFGEDFFTDTNVVTSLTNQPYTLENISESMTATAGIVFGARTTSIEVYQESFPSSVARLFIGLALENDQVRPDVEFSEEIIPGDCPAEQTIIRTWQSSDLCGNVTEIMQTISIQDTVPPLFTETPDDTIIVANTEDFCTATANWVSPVIWDDCSEVSSESTAAPGDIFENGITTVLYTATDECGNVSTYTFNISVEDRQQPNLSINTEFTFCENEAIEWEEDVWDNCGIQSIERSHDSGSFFPVGITTVYITVTDFEGNDSTVFFDIEVLQGPDLELSQSEVYECVGEDLTVEVINSNSAYDYSWFEGGTLVSDNEVFTLNTTGMEVGSYLYYVQAEDSFGCKSKDSLWVEIQFCELEIVEIFSPNGDGINDYFYIKNLEQYPQSSVQIFNRWGARVFESNDYQNDWDGTSQNQLNTGGEALPEGTYFYVLTPGEGGNGDPLSGKVYKGYVYLKQ